MNDLILGSHIYVARKGDVIDGITVAKDARPDTDPETNWTKMPTCEEFEPIIDRNVVPRWAPSPGKFRKDRVVLTSQELKYAFALQEWTEMMFAEILLGAAPPVGGVYTPGGASELWEGWMKIQNYDQKDQLINVSDTWCVLTGEPYRFKNGLETYTLMAEVLHSDLNEGALTNI